MEKLKAELSQLTGKLKSVESENVRLQEEKKRSALKGELLDQKLAPAHSVPPSGTTGAAAAAAAAERTRIKLEDQVEELQEQLAQLKSKLKRCESENVRLQEEADNRKRNSSEAARLQVRVASLQQKCAEAVEISQAVKAENKRLEAEILRLRQSTNDPQNTASVITPVTSDAQRKGAATAPKVDAKSEKKMVDLEAEVQRMQQETARLSEQRDALRVELKNAKKREEEIETALAAAKLSIRDLSAREKAAKPLLQAPAPQNAEGERESAAAAAAHASASLSNRTELARKNADAMLTKTELARRVPLIGRSLGRMVRRQELGQLSLSWEGWLQVLDDKAELQDQMETIGRKFVQIDRKLAVLRAWQGWKQLSAEAQQFQTEVQMLQLSSTIRALSGQFMPRWLERWKSVVHVSRTRFQCIEMLERASARRSFAATFFAWSRDGHLTRLVQLKSRSNLSLFLPHAVQLNNHKVCRKLLQLWRHGCKTAKALERKCRKFIARRHLSFGRRFMKL